MLHIQRVNSLGELLSLEKVWSDLLGRYQNKELFLTHAWVVNWWKHFGRERELFILLVKDGDEIIGIAPMMLSRDKLKVFPVRKLGLFFNNHSPRSDFILPERRKESLYALVRYWEESSGFWDVIQLETIAESSGTLKALTEILNKSKLFSLPLKSWVNQYLPIEKADWQAYLKSRTPKFRKGLRYEYNKAARLGRVACTRFDSPQEIEAACLKFLDVDLKSWKREGGSTIAADEDTRNYYLELAKVFAQKQHCEVRLLEVDDRPIAGVLSVIYNDIVYPLKTSYDDNFASVSPGVLIFTFLFEDFWSSGIKEFDFINKIAFTEKWTQHSRSYNRALIFNKQIYSRLLEYLIRKYLSLKESQKLSETAMP